MTTSPTNQPVKLDNSIVSTTQSQTSPEIHHPIIASEVQQQFFLSGIALATIFALAFLFKEIRRLVESCKE